jgi:hypothetical protein
LAAEEQQRQGEDQDNGGRDEPEATNDRAPDAPHTVGTEQRQLGRRRTRQQAACGVRVLKLSGVHPPFPLDHQVAEQGDVRRWAAETRDPDP